MAKLRNQSLLNAENLKNIALKVWLFYMFTLHLQANVSCIRECKLHSTQIHLFIIKNVKAYRLYITSKQ